jgi:hypothetical protein
MADGALCSLKSALLEGSDASEAIMRKSTTLALALVVSFAGLSLAYATEDVAPMPPHHHHRAHHRLPVVREAAPAPEPAAAAPAAVAPQAAPFGLAWPHIAPYRDGKGDEDGTSEDEDDCNKGCIDGNTPD